MRTLQAFVSCAALTLTLGLIDFKHCLCANRRGIADGHHHRSKRCNRPRCDRDRYQSGNKRGLHRRRQRGR